MILASIVVPVHYNAATLDPLLRRLRAVADGLPGCDFEFVFVDDESGDDSFEILKRHSLSDGRIRGLRLSRNFGSNAAILAGRTYARGDSIVVISADLQDPPELIAEMIPRWQEGAEVVMAARRRREDPFLNRISASGFNRLFKKLVFADFPAGGFDFVLMSRRVARLAVDISENIRTYSGK